MLCSIAIQPTVLLNIIHLPYTAECDDTYNDSFTNSTTTHPITNDSIITLLKYMHSTLYHMHHTVAIFVTYRIHTHAWHI